MLGIVAQGLKGLKEKVVFVGGATVDLFITDPAAAGTRATVDVDCIVELVRLGKYYALEEELRALGFQHPTEENPPICRWMFRGIKVDVMPTEGAILGFSSRWYRDGMAKAEQAALPNGESIYVFSVPYLLASKLEAFRDRGHEDFQSSKDLEDVIVLLDGHLEAEAKIDAAPAGVRRYLKEESARMLADKRFLLSLEGHLSAGRPVAEGERRREKFLALMRRIAGPAAAA
ncbi:MAG: nucleotidyl transferase AbiEii/AbiGii toxin family protein [Elusimicrobia bacterium]|nr:nucleotidyl transferase AbiEii/AbiGii toxin family protein [Elusimicrobiota bacterium]